MVKAPSLVIPPKGAEKVMSAVPESIVRFCAPLIVLAKEILPPVAELESIIAVPFKVMGAANCIVASWVMRVPPKETDPTPFCWKAPSISKLEPA